MLKVLTQSPFKHVEGNLIFSEDERVFSVMEIEGFEYDFMDDSTKRAYFTNQLALFSQLESDMQLLVVPKTTNADEILDEHIASLTGPMASSGRWLFERMKEYLRKTSATTENTEYHFYLLVQLNAAKKEKQIVNPMVEGWKMLKQLKKGFTKSAHEAIGFLESDILEEDILEYQRIEEIVFNQIASTFKHVRRASSASIRYLIQHNFTRGMTEPERVKRWNPGYMVEGTDKEGTIVKARRPDRQQLLQLTDCVIDESPGRSLILERQNDEGDIERMHVAFLAVRNMSEAFAFPGCEWIYHIQSQSLKFPVEISIRAHHLPNEMVVKKLTNSELELNDQRRQAAVGGGTTDLTIERKAKGVKFMQDRFQTTGAPGYEMSVLFCVYAEDEKTLQSRIKTLITEYKKLKIELVNPYGDQMALFYEFLPGAMRYNEDFKIFVEPGVLAAGMFGATTQIGDNIGFYLGRTAKLNRMVFVNPSLYAKALDHLATEFDSLSIMVAGQTGKGKSVLLNLLGYWIVMSGGRAFFTDPKGDRGEWPEKLPGFEKDQLAVWTLGKSEEDAGCLDPFRISATMEDAKTLALELLTFLADISLEDSRYDYLVHAIEQVSGLEDPCLTLIKAELIKQKTEALSDTEKEQIDRMVRRFITIEKTPLANLLFGKPGQQYRALDLKRPMQVLQIQHLRLPKAGEEGKNILDKLSRSVLLALTAFGKSLMNSDRSTFKIYVQDEAASILKNTEGSRLADEIIRKGRYHNTGLYLGTQNASDFQSENKEIANVGMKFSFSLKYDEEAVDMLRYYNLPVTPDNIKMLRNLRRGQALFQDAYGRTAVINIDPVFKELLTAFDSSTKSEEEREREFELV